MSRTATRHSLQPSPTLASLIPQLVNETGHYYAYAKALEGACRRIGWDYTAALPQNSRLPALPANWQKCLYTDRTQWRKQLPLALRAVIRQSVSIGRFLKPVARRSDQQSILFIDSLDQGHLLSLNLSMIFFKNRPSQIWIFCRFPTQRLLMKGILLRLLSSFSQMMLRPSGRVVFLTDSELLQRSYARLLARMPVLVPIPHTHFAPAPAKKPGPSDALTLWWPGEPREQKGRGIIQHIAGIDLDGKLRFKLLVAENSGIRSVPSGVKVETVTNPLSEVEYANTLSRADIILLPYDSNHYGEATSGIFVESVVAGKLPLVSRKTWMAFELEKFGLKKLIIDWSNERIFSLIAGLSSSALIRERLLRMRDSYRLFHNELSYANQMLHIYREGGWAPSSDC